MRIGPKCPKKRSKIRVARRGLWNVASGGREVFYYLARRSRHEYVMLSPRAVSQAIISDPTDRCPGNRARFIQLLQGLEKGQPLPHRKVTP